MSYRSVLAVVPLLLSLLMACSVSNGYQSAQVYLNTVFTVSLAVNF